MIYVNLFSYTLCWSSLPIPLVCSSPNHEVLFRTFHACVWLICAHKCSLPPLKEVLVCILACPHTHNPLSSAFRMLQLQGCATKPGPILPFLAHLGTS